MSKNGSKRGKLGDDPVGVEPLTGQLVRLQPEDASEHEKKKKKKDREREKHKKSAVETDSKKALKREKKREKLQEAHIRAIRLLTKAVKRVRREADEARMLAVLEERLSATESKSVLDAEEVLPPQAPLLRITESSSTPRQLPPSSVAPALRGHDRKNDASSAAAVAPPSRFGWLPWRRKPGPLDPRRQAVLRSIPRRERLKTVGTARSRAPMTRSVHFKASKSLVLRRLVVWAFALGSVVLGNLTDRFRRLERDESAQRRRGAKRVRRAIELMGGSAVKIGQQAAMRLDLLPQEYTDELSDMLDKVPPFKPEEAIAAIERALKRPLYEVFDVFDPDHIGAASVACVYQARLKDGTKVAVKVRRPGIGPRFMADTDALSLLFTIAEWTTMVRPGMTKNLIYEFRDMLMGELDFVREARNSEMFQLDLDKTKIRYARAPKVFFDLCSEEVMVSEFVDGIWLTEVLSAVETKDPTGLALLKELKISPRRVARRLLEVNRLNGFESLLFHADPHPGNIVVQPNSKLVLIDFGACGSYTQKERRIWARLLEAQRNNDVGLMVQSAISLIEPLPPIDIDEFTKKLEAVFWQDLFAFKSKHSEWWERTSAGIWLNFLRLSREYDIPMNLNTLRMIRATLLYDTIAARLDSKINAYEEYHRYTKRAGARAKKRVQREVWRTLLCDWPKRNWLRVEELFSVVSRTVDIASHLLDNPPYAFASLITKGVFAVQRILKAGFWILMPGAALWGYYVIVNITCGHKMGGGLWPFQLIDALCSVAKILHEPEDMSRPYEFKDALYDVVRTGWYIVWVLFVIGFNLRTLNYRLRDKDDTTTSRRTGR